MPELSICMPSNRNLAEARAAIDSALAYCEARDALLIISDNSGDAEKRAYLEGLSPRLTLIDAGNATLSENLRLALNAATTAFIMPMGDDDEIRAVEGMPAFDLASLPYDYVGVLPVSIPFSVARGDMEAKAFALTAEDPGERIAQYSSGAKGNNSLYYSIFRRDVFNSMMHDFLEYHPTKGLYCDWAIIVTMICYGKMAHDPGTVFRYNMSNWDSAQKTGQSNADLYRSAGLPADAAKFHGLLLYLDVFVLVMRSGSPVPPAERQRLARIVNNRLLASFITGVANAPQDYDGTLRHLATMAVDENDSFVAFQIALMMIDRLQPGLKDRYVAFFKAVMAPA
ncbi:MULTISPECIES: glycosyltransferase family 2 protein [Alphaproteobacteria]|uniref:Glycosyltransferase 2-like domain-containing protein n=2 Tax=Alphaproteobacteria TaxID=28211 RepID=A0A512HD55_9HYPH|nr:MULTISPECIES: glycosyltransferase [Alphaproteobacteria]GEO83383.1 hypothetical protein RNA01_03150 [Ciceribacter naphthalenivorans]GLR20223.1 hypothetical protein GCM10007920_00070 [Ciceribacter naphthalenivorans]GLT03079.1 hypothetical protein GCM10007926_00070 [Sphingomonas psychrolutea]